MPSNRDNFLEIVKAWCDYARVCQAVKHEPVTLQAFRAMECEWDGPPSGDSVTIGCLKATTVDGVRTLDNITVRDYDPKGIFSPNMNIGKPKPIKKQLIVNSVKVRPYKPDDGDGRSPHSGDCRHCGRAYPDGGVAQAKWLVTIYIGNENIPIGGTAIVNSPTAKMAAASEIAQYLYELDLLEVADK